MQKLFAYASGLVHVSPTVKMNVSVAPLRAVCIWKRKRNWPCFLLLLLAAFLGVAYYTTGPVFMENAKDAIELTQNNIAFVMQLDEGRVKDVERFVYRFKQCLASICQHSSIGLTIHIFANSMGKRESTKVLQVLAPNCFNGMKVKFYDIERIVLKLLPSINEKCILFS